MAAKALMGVQRALVAHVRAPVLGGRRGPKLTADAGSQAKRAFARLEAGLTDDARKPPSPAGRGSTDQRDPGT